MTNLKKLRLKLHYTQKHIATHPLINVSVATYSRWECGKMMPRVSKLSALAEVLQCTIDDLLTMPKQGGY